MQEWLKNPDDVKDIYDPKKREPQYCSADTSKLWELVPLVNHFHPTITHHITSISNAEEITSYKDANPLQSHSISQFLDRFVYKNPKSKISESKTGSLLSMNNSVLIPLQKKRQLKYSVQDKEFLKMNPENVPADEVFYFS